MDEIASIAKKHNLKVIYDAAHAFGITDQSGSVLNHGDLFVLSFHATKVFNTFEGGAIVCQNPELKRKIDDLKNFGIADEVNVRSLGINGKMSEFNAALGLLQIKYLNAAIKYRKKVSQDYYTLLDAIKGVQLMRRDWIEKTNFSYFSIKITKEHSISRDQIYEILKQNGIYTRRYFYLLISEMKIYRAYQSSQISNLPVASKVSSEILCLPIFVGLGQETIDKICRILIS